MHILVFGSEYFHEALAAQGHTVIAPPHQDGFPLSDFYNTRMDRPDLLIYVDHLGQHGWPQGLDELDIPKVYYAVDTPINFWWQKRFAPLFDLVFADQKPYAAQLEAQGLAARWLPVAVNTSAYEGDKAAGTPKIYDFGFVGVVNERVRAKRSQLIKQLSARWRLKTEGDRQEGWVTPGESSAIYRQSRMILNENLFPGVTTRMFEAMASGTPLFTEKAGGDLGELFQPGEDFAWFEPGELFEAAEYWLSDDGRLAAMAARALEKVRAGHDIKNRAATVLEAAKTLHAGRALTGPSAWDAEGRTLFLTALRWPNEEGKARIGRAEKLLLKASEEARLSPEGKFMLGHISRLKGDAEKAALWLSRAWDEGYGRAALGLGFLALGARQIDEAAKWFGEFTGLKGGFPRPQADLLPFEAVLPIAAKLVELGEAITPGFNLMPHDPALWTALEYYVSAHRAKPDNLEAGRALAKLLLESGAPAEAMQVAGATLKTHPEDEELSGLYSRAAVNSYTSLN